MTEYLGKDYVILRRESRATWQRALENLALAKGLATKAESLGNSSLIMARKVQTNRIRLED